MFIILLSTHLVAHPLRHPDKDNTLAHHVITLVHCCWRESQSSPVWRWPRAVGLPDTKAAADRLGPPGEVDGGGNWAPRPWSVSGLGTIAESR